MRRTPVPPRCLLLWIWRRHTHARAPLVERGIRRDSPAGAGWSTEGGSWRIGLRRPPSPAPARPRPSAVASYASSRRPAISLPLAFSSPPPPRMPPNHPPTPFRFCNNIRITRPSSMQPYMPAMGFVANTSPLKIIVVVIVRYHSISLHELQTGFF
jgi:hypothetical protein